MHPAVGKQSFVQKTLAHVANEVRQNSPDAQAAIAEAIGTPDPAQVEAERTRLESRLVSASAASTTEPSHQDVHFVSRIDGVGLFQSVLAKVFWNIPDLQALGNKNPSWVATLVEQVVSDVGTFFKRVYTDVHGNKKPLLHSIMQELHNLRDTRAPFPPGVPETISLPDSVVIALLADWGGDNDAAKSVAGIVRKHTPDVGIHLGDIYYGGIREECEIFLRLWPFNTDVSGNSPQFEPGRSFALNGNHEMYSGGESYFGLVLRAFGQPQSFFCLQNQHWRIIGLDTAYAGGHLKPSGPNDPITTQWDWLVNLLRTGPKRANIFLTHHQPVSAHRQEFSDSAPLRAEIQELLSMNGIGQDAIFGWFFGHEHRCAAYDDRATPYNARLIGNGCIPHQVQTEKAADPGCTPVAFFNKRETRPGSNAAVSSFAELRFAGTELLITYCDEDNLVWGSELWDASKGRLGGTKFGEYDGLMQTARGVGSPGK
jgi:Calcineurin-like phosphoesterase